MDINNHTVLTCKGIMETFTLLSLYKFLSLAKIVIPCVL